MRNEDYQLYLRSPAWREITRWVRKREWNLCERCRINRIDEIHHLTYKHIFQEQDYLEDLMGVCCDCHDELHGRQAEDLGQLWSSEEANKWRAE